MMKLQLTDMTNKEIASGYNELATLMEYQGESVFKVRSYQNAYQLFRKMDLDLCSMNREQLLELPGIGSAIADKVIQMCNQGSFDMLDHYRNLIPDGIRELLQVRGLGVSKVKQLVEQLEITNLGELLYACEENRLISLKGFGIKSQENIAEKVRFALDNKGLYLLSNVLDKAEKVIEILREKFPNEKHDMTGSIRRMEQVIESIDIITTLSFKDIEASDMFQVEASSWSFQGIPIVIVHSSKQDFFKELVLSTGGLSLPEIRNNTNTFNNETDVFNSINMPWIHPSRRDPIWQNDLSKAENIPLIQEEDIKGIIHAHSQYSDGSASLKDMANYCYDQGFEYLGISDHSRTAVYAEGLSKERVLEQFSEIDKLNESNSEFKIFKGIESDILSDGNLDYPTEILSQFDFIIASVHSILNMDINRATERLIKAIENPYTTILGHPTGRLLLSRSGYPIDHQKIIDAAASNQVIIEINANPNRLDIDYSWIQYAMDKGVMLSINPDAHSMRGIHDIRWGLIAANKGGLYKELCLNCMDLNSITAYFKNRRSL
jgi:DNA polymerase (family 10)